MASPSVAAEAEAVGAPDQALSSVRSPNMALLIAMGIFVSTFAQDQTLALLPFRHVLQHDMHANETMSAQFFFWAGLAWYFKPLFGILSDAVPMLGTRRKSYLVAGSLASAVLWGAFAFVPHRYLPFVVMITAVNTALVVVSTVTGGLLVEEGQRAKATGRLSSIRNAMMCFAGVVAGPIGGWIADKEFSWTAAIGAGLCAAQLVGAAFLLFEKRNPEVDRGALKNSTDQLKMAFSSKPLLLAALFTFLVSFAPGFQTPLYYYQTKELHFDDEFIGVHLLTLSNLFGILGSVAYAGMCRRFNLRKMIVFALLAQGLTALFYLHYRTPLQAEITESIYGFGVYFANVMTLDLAAQATPRGCEAMAYSLLMSAYNIASKGADWLGSFLLNHFHLVFPQLVWINTATTLLTILAIRLLPLKLLDHRDGGGAEANPSVEPILDTAAA